MGRENAWMGGLVTLMVTGVLLVGNTAEAMLVELDAAVDGDIQNDTTVAQDNSGTFLLRFGSNAGDDFETIAHFDLTSLGKGVVTGATLSLPLVSGTVDGGQIEGLIPATGGTLALSDATAGGTSIETGIATTDFNRTSGSVEYGDFSPTTLVDFLNDAISSNETFVAFRISQTDTTAQLRAEELGDVDPGLANPIELDVTVIPTPAALPAGLVMLAVLVRRRRGQEAGRVV